MRGLVRGSHALNPTCISLEFGIGIFWYRYRDSAAFLIQYADERKGTRREECQDGGAIVTDYSGVRKRRPALNMTSLTSASSSELP
jgi:hypothetical protein